eukprot:3403537-Pleurochrysis_carterae.AAC.1
MPTLLQQMQGAQVYANVTQLAAGRNYSVAVEAFNSFGSSGNESAPRAFYSTRGVPQASFAPFLGPRLPGLDLTSMIFLNWHRPFDNGVQISGFELAMDGDVTNLVRLNFPEIDGYTWTSLRSGTVYHFALRCLNSLGAGRWSPVVAFATEPGPPFAPAAVNLTQSDETGSRAIITVTEPVHDGGSPILFYEIRSSVDMVWVIVNASKIKNVEVARNAEGTYEDTLIEVRAWNSIGVSPTAQILLTSNLRSRPSSPTDILITEIGVSSINMTWQMRNVPKDLSA